MKVLTIKQPWATLIMQGDKRFEFRSWQTKYRGDLLIHAGKGIDKEAMKRLENYLPEELPRGEILGKVKLVDCIKMSPEFKGMLLKENADIYTESSFSENYGWQLEDVKVFEKPIPAKGQLGLWEYEVEESGDKQIIVEKNDIIDLDRLNKLGYTSISIEVYEVRENLELIEQEIDEQDIIDKCMINVYIKIFASNIDTKNKEKIGYLKGNFFESEILTDDIDFYTLCDSIGSDLEPMAAAIRNEDGWIRDEICEFDENLMYIDRMYIEEKYRGLGIASYVLNSIKQILIYAINLYPNVLILLPKPQEKDEEGHLRNVRDKNIKEKNKKKLFEFYKNLGFEKLSDSDYMIKRLDAMERELE